MTQPPTHSLQLCPVTRDDPGYWRRRPADHGPDGLYRDGPHQARQRVLASLLGSQPSATEIARQRGVYEQAQARVRRRARQAVPAPALPHPRQCKKAVRVLGVRAA